MPAFAGLATGFWESEAEIRGQCPEDRRFDPAMSPGTAARLSARCQRALDRSRGWEEPEKKRAAGESDAPQS